MSQNRANSTAFIEAEQYSAFILRNLQDGMLPGTFYRNVSDFGSGSTLHIKTVGSVTIQDGAEEVPFDYTPIESGEVTLTITDYVGDAWYVTDELREDGAQVEALMSARSSESTRAIQEVFETRFLKKCNTAQTNANANLVNGFAHRIASAVATSGSENTILLDHFIKMKLAFDKANVPMAGRIAIVDPVVGATMDRLVSVNRDVTPFGQRILENGFDRDHTFLMNLYGWNIISSNRLDKGTFSDGTTSVSNAVANVFMCVADDNTKPIMGAWRRMPKVEGERNKDLRRDEFVTSCRWGLGTQRVDTLGIVITSAVNI
jgi:hypothetical protein